MTKIRKLDEKVRAVLADDPQSRNSDIRLTQEIWKRYYREKLRFDGYGSYYAGLDDLFDLPREDNIKRIRAQIQNVEKKWVPTSLEVARQRKWNEDEWRKYVAKQQPLFDV